MMFSMLWNCDYCGTLLIWPMARRNKVSDGVICTECLEAHTPENVEKPT